MKDGISVPDRFKCSDDRGQLVLAGAIIIAALLVVLVVIMNSVLYTENIATREQPQSVDRSIDLVSVIEQTVAELIVAENSQLETTDGSSADTINRDLVNIQSVVSNRSFEAHSERVSISEKDVQEAWVIRQDQSGEFDSADTAIGPGSQDTWPVITANGLRNGYLSVDTASSVNPTAENESEDVFTVHIESADGSGDEWTLYVFEHPSETGISFGTMTDADNNPVPMCSSGSTPAEVDLVTMNITNGDDCGFEFAEGVGNPPYNVVFENGDEAQGTYSIVAGENNGANIPSLGPIASVHDTTTGGSVHLDEPTAYDGVYSTRTELVIDGPSTTLETTVYVAPRESEYTESDVKP